MFNSPEFKVGFLVVVVSGIIGFMSLKVAEGPGFLGLPNKYHFVIDDANGLVKNSTVRIAGIKVGVIEDIKLKNGKAVVYMLLDSNVKLTTSSYVEIRADGILGDKHVEIFQGNLNDPILKSGSEVRASKARGSIDAVVAEVGKISDSLGALTETLRKAMTGEGDTSSPVGRIIKNLENLTEDLAKVTGKNKKKLNDIVERIHSITAQVDDFLKDDGENGFASSWQKAIKSLSRIDRSLRNVEEITDKINHGEGTLGRLINDDSTVESINEAVDNVNNLLGNVSVLETSLDFHSEYLAQSDAMKSYLNFKIQPGLDRYYELGIVDDPEGVAKEIDTTVSSGGSSNTTNTRIVERNKVKFTALFAKNFYDFTIKGGLIENYGGVGVDYRLFRQSIRLSLEAFDFQNLNLRTFVRYSPIRGVYLIGGGDNVLSSTEKNAFLGAGIFITNDDLKMLASKFSFF
ncbi:MAG: MCE family protein [Bdellovibrio sp.]|nr:MAG: MCE family protein [Bdellovibrio sp.]